MELNIAPAFRITANAKDITATIRDRLKSLRFTDESGGTADTLEICIADHDPLKPVAIPPTGAELELFLGYDGKVRRMGAFVCDEIELAGFAGEMTIRASAAPYTKSTGGQVDLQSQKTRSWKAGTTIGAMVQRMAGEHRLKPSVSPKLASIVLPHTDQSSESDMNLLLRLAKRYDAVAKPAGGHLLFVKRGEAKSASGEALPRVVLTPKDGNNYRVTLASRDSAGTVVAYYRDVGKAKRMEIAVGEGEPVRRLRMSYRDQASAIEAGKAELRKRARNERGLSFDFPGRPEVTAEAILEMKGFRDGVAGDWLVSRVEHYIGPQGYRCTIEAEQPNSAEDVAAVDQAAQDDREQPATEV